MQRNRYILCLLACGLMLYFAIPHLSVTAHGAKGLFSILWLLLALFAAAGNLSGILFFPRKKSLARKMRKSSQMERKTRSYH